MNRFALVFLTAVCTAIPVTLTACRSSDEANTPEDTDSQTQDTDVAAGDTDVQLSTCDGLLVQDECGVCVDTQCCSELDSCFADVGCLECAVGVKTEGCDEPGIAALLGSLLTCTVDACQAACSPVTVPPADPLDPPAPECNPVTNARCGVDEVCDFDFFSGGFTCFPPGTDAAICQSCNVISGPFCGPGLACNVTDAATAGGTCARSCCEDADCGSGTCEFVGSMPANDWGVGLCVDASTPVMASVCDAPAVSPSAGACAN